MEKTVVKSIFISILFLLVGIGLTIFGVNTINDYKSKKQSYVEVNAKVVDYEYPDVTENSAYTIYEFSVDGVNYRVKSDSQSSILPSLGSNVTIMYNPNNPNDVIFLGGSNYFLLIIGIIFSGVGIFALFRGLSLKKAAANIKYDNTDISNVSGPNN